MHIEIIHWWIEHEYRMNEINQDQCELCSQTGRNGWRWGHRVMRPEESCLAQRCETLTEMAEGMWDSIYFLLGNAPDVFSPSHSVHVPQVTYSAMSWAFQKTRHIPPSLSCWKNSRCCLCDNLETSTNTKRFKDWGLTRPLQPLARSSDYQTERFSWFTAQNCSFRFVSISCI